MDQPPAVAFTVSADVWPRGYRNGDRRSPMRHWARERTLTFSDGNVSQFLCCSPIDKM